MRTKRMLFRAALLSSVLAPAAFASGAESRRFTVLHDFAGRPNDGSIPLSNASLDREGNIFGTANHGGTTKDGVIFRIAPDGTEIILHSFAGGRDGSGPAGGVTIDPSSGDLYGTTTFGGRKFCYHGCGVLYRLASDGTYTVLNYFNVGIDGFWPAGQILRDSQGNLFGTAAAGGPAEEGTLFEYSARGHFTVLHAFNESDGSAPLGNLIEDKGGNIYGVTSSGGADEQGTVFEFTSTGEFKTLYSFTGGADGGNPAGGLAVDSMGTLYGATNLAGSNTTPYGTVFRLAPDGTLTTLYAFAGGSDGGYPAGNVLESRGKLFGTTTSGGVNNDGVVYEIDASGGNEMVLHSFNGADGRIPEAGLTEENGRLYGTASVGGANDLGVVFSLKK